MGEGVGPGDAGTGDQPQQDHTKQKAGDAGVGAMNDFAGQTYRWEAEGKNPVCRPVQPTAGDRPGSGDAAQGGRGDAVDAANRAVCDPNFYPERADMSRAPAPSGESAADKPGKLIGHKEPHSASAYDRPREGLGADRAPSEGKLTPQLEQRMIGYLFQHGVDTAASRSERGWVSALRDQFGTPGSAWAESAPRHRDDLYRAFSSEERSQIASYIEQAERLVLRREVLTESHPTIGEARGGTISDREKTQWAREYVGRLDEILHMWDQAAAFGGIVAGVAARVRINAGMRTGMSRAGSESKPRFKEAGSGGSTWHVTMNVDEPLAVGQPGISPAESMRRAMDLGNRQFLDLMTNQATKGERVEVPSSARTASSPPPTSVAENPAALLTRPALRGVTEWDAMSANILEKKGPSLEGKSPKQVKNILNRAIRDEIKSPTTEAGRAISEALSKLFPGVPPTDYFRAQRIRRNQ